MTQEAQVDDEVVIDEPIEEGETPEVDPVADEGDEVVITIGDEPPPAEEDEFKGQPAPAWVKELREDRKRLLRENTELKQRQTPAVVETITVGDEPTLESSEYDEAKFKANWVKWNQRKQDQDTEKRKKADESKKATDEWQARLNHHNKLKSELKVKDYSDAEEFISETLNTWQQGLVVQGADNSAVVNYALYKNPKKAKELASITDPVKFAFAVAKLESQLKVTPRTSAPLPERVVRGNVAVTANVDGTLERLREQADRSGDRTKVAAYMRQKAQEKQARKA